MNLLVVTFLSKAYLFQINTWLHKTNHLVIGNSMDYPSLLGLTGASNLHVVAISSMNYIC